MEHPTPVVPVMAPRTALQDRFPTAYTILSR